MTVAATLCLSTGEQVLWVQKLSDLNAGGRRAGAAGGIEQGGTGP